MIIRQLEVGNMAVFAYLVAADGGGDGIVIDPAGDVDHILAVAKKLKIAVKCIVNTHGHVDHIAGNTEMKEKTGAEIIIHSEDAPMLTSTPAMILRMFGAQQSPPADRTVTEGDVISVGAASLRVMHTPGHSPGGISLYAPGVVFTGDTLFVESVGRSDLPGGSWPVMLRSIRERLLTLPDETTVYPGHNYGRTPSSTIGHEKKYNPFLH
jgi:hydroxyacylglutathione hydrolase